MFRSTAPRRPSAWRSLLAALAGASLAAGLALATAPAQAALVDCSQPLDVHLSYAVNNTLDVPITDVITFNRYAVCTEPGSWWPSSVDSGGSTITDPFTMSSSNMPQQALMLGLATNLPNDAEGQMHVVMMVDNAAAQAAQNIAWGTTFLNTLEDRIVADLELTMRTDRNLLTGPAADAWDAALTELYDFVLGDGASMWFNLPANIQPGTTTTSEFSVVAWSDGQIIGNGVASLTRDVVPPATVPVPGTLALAALGALGALRARRSPGATLTAGGATIDRAMRGG